MHLLSFICILGLSTATSIDVHDDKASRRLSYSTNVVHKNAQYPSSQASSSINFKFGTDALSDEAASIETAGSNSPATHSSYNNIFKQTTPKAIHDYSQEDFYKLNSPAESTQTYNPKPTYRPVQYTKPATSSAPQSQSFNVGYSMSFTNNKAPKTPRYDSGGDIITGRKKEEVSRPTSSEATFAGDDFIRNSFIDTKKQKISGIKSKYTKIPKITVNAQQLLTQANLSPKTQKQLAYLETAKNTGNKFSTETRQQVASSNSPWQNLSPTVEIYHSQELKPTYNEDTKAFDHSRALGKSEGFDYTNAVDFSNLQLGVAKLANTPPVYETKSNSYYKQLGVNPYSGDYKSSASSQYSKPLQTYSSKPLSLPKLPIDTSLLRDPYLTTEKHATPTGGKSIPIHFDTTLIQEMISGKQMYSGNLNAAKELVQGTSHTEALTDTEDSSSGSYETPHNSYSEEPYKGINFKQPISVYSDKESSHIGSGISKHAEQFNNQFSAQIVGQHSSLDGKYYKLPNLSDIRTYSSPAKSNQESAFNKYSFKPPSDSYKQPSNGQSYEAPKSSSSGSSYEAPKQFFNQRENNGYNKPSSKPLFESINAQLGNDQKPKYYPNPSLNTNSNMNSKSIYYKEATNTNSKPKYEYTSSDAHREASSNHQSTKYKHHIRDLPRDQHYAQTVNKNQSYRQQNDYAQDQQEITAHKTIQNNGRPMSNSYNKPQNIRHEYIKETDPMKEVNKYKELVNSKDYDFQKEFDKLLYGADSNTANRGNGNSNKPPLQSQIRYTHNNNGFNNSNGHNNANSHNIANSHNNGNSHNVGKNYNQKRESQFPRQSRINYKTRIVREFIDTDLKPPPMENARLRRMQSIPFNLQ